MSIVRNSIYRCDTFAATATILDCTVCEITLSSGAFSLGPVSATKTDVVFKFVIDTTAWPVGKMNYMIRATISGVKQTIETGIIDVKPDISSPDFDPRSNNEKIWQNLEDLMMNMSADDVISFEIEGRKYQKVSMLEINKLRIHYKMLTNIEKGRF